MVCLETNGPHERLGHDGCRVLQAHAAEDLPWEVQSVAAITHTFLRGAYDSCNQDLKGRGGQVHQNNAVAGCGADRFPWFSYFAAPRLSPLAAVSCSQGKYMPTGNNAHKRTHSGADSSFCTNFHKSHQGPSGQAQTAEALKYHSIGPTQMPRAPRPEHHLTPKLSKPQPQTGHT